MCAYLFVVAFTLINKPLVKQWADTRGQFKIGKPQWNHIERQISIIQAYFGLNYSQTPKWRVQLASVINYEFNCVHTN